MKETVWVLFFCLFPFVCGCASNYESTGSMTLNETAPSFIEEENLAWDEKYKDEPMVFSYEEDIIEVRRDYSYTEDVHFVIKIQNDKGKDIGEFPIPYDKSREVIEDIRAYTITPSGENVRCMAIHDFNTQERFSLYSDDRVKVLTMPKVTVGCYLDIRMRVLHKKPLIEGCFFETLTFSGEFPIKASHKKLIVPKEIHLNFKSQNSEIRPEVTHLDDEVVYVWNVKGRDKVAIEEQMPDPSELCEKVFISTLDKWEELGTWAWSLFNKNLIVNQDIKNMTQKITKNRETLKEKIQAVVEHIQREYRYVSMQLDFHGYEAHRVDEIFNLKYGDCKDQTLLAIAMLSEIGVVAHPGLFCSSFDPHFKERLPIPLYFNHAILCINYEGKLYYTDLLQKGFYFDEIPYHLAGGYVFVVKEKGAFLDRVPSSKEDVYRTLSMFNVSMRGDGSAFVKGQLSLARNMSNLLRQQFEVISEDEKQKLISSFYEPLTLGGEIIKEDWINIDDHYKNIEIMMEFERPDFSRLMGDLMMFGIGQMKRLASFSAKERKYPIEFKQDMISQDVIRYTIPEGFEIVNIPENIAFNREFIDFSRKYETKENKITEKQIFRFRMCRLEPEEYQNVRELFNQITRSTNVVIVIKKKS